MPNIDLSGGDYSDWPIRGSRRVMTDPTYGASGQPTAGVNNPAPPQRATSAPDPLSGLPQQLVRAFYPGNGGATVNDPTAAAAYLQPFVQPFQSGNWQGFFQQLTKGAQASPAALSAYAPILKALGYNVLSNASGQISGKITDPSGAGWDVGKAFGTNDPSQMAWQWLSTAGGGAGGTGSGVYGDPHTALYENSVLAALDRLAHPADDPFRNLEQLASLRRANDLFSNDPYTSGDDAALVAKYMEPLTQARDAAIQQARERTSARGFLPSSGLLEGDINQITQGYEKGVAAGANNLGVQAVNEKQRRQDEALSVLDNLEQLSTSGRMEDRQRQQDILSTAALLPNLDSSRLDALLRAASPDASSSPSSILSGILGLGGQNLTAQQIQAAQSQATAQGWGQFFGYLLNNLDKFQGLFGA